MWLDEAEVEQVSEGTFDFAARFTNPDSVDKLPATATFDKPKGFDDKIEKVVQIL